VIEPGLVNRRDGRGIELIAQVDAADFGADVLRQRDNVEPAERRGGHG